MSHDGNSGEASENIDEAENEPVEDRRNVCEVFDSEPVLGSPIDINVSKTTPVYVAPQLNWVNFDLPPKKMKITNSGHTVILSGKWGQERPYITNGVLTGKYVFSQIHLHWGINDMEGSEHTIDGSRYPGEVHVVMFKSCYLTQESALKERDGVVILVYILKLQDPPNPDFQLIIDAVPGIAKAHTSSKVPAVQLNCLIKEFQSDYFMYRGSVTTADCVHQIFWLITRTPIAVSLDQMDSLRYLLDNDDEIIRRNFRPIQPISDRHVFHILPSKSKYSTLLQAPLLDVGDTTVSQIYRIQLLDSTPMKYVWRKVTSDEKAGKAPKEIKSLNENVLLTDEDITKRTISIISELGAEKACYCL